VWPDCFILQIRKQIQKVACRTLDIRSYHTCKSKHTHTHTHTHTPALLFHWLPLFSTFIFQVRFISSNKNFSALQLDYFFPLCLSPTMTFTTIYSLLNYQPAPPDSKYLVLGILSVLFLVICQGSLHSLRSYGICSINIWWMNKHRN